jgi:hypothetical protein
MAHQTFHSRYQPAVAQAIDPIYSPWTFGRGHLEVLGCQAVTWVRSQPVIAPRMLLTRSWEMYMRHDPVSDIATVFVSR